MSLNDADIEFNTNRFFKMFCLHTLFALLGPMTALLLRVAFGSWTFANNVGFTVSGSTRFYKVFQAMYQMIFLMGNVVYINALVDRRWNLVQTHRDGFDLVLLVSTWLQILIRSFMIGLKYGTFTDL